MGIDYIYRDLQKSFEAIDSFKQQGNQEQYQTALNEIEKLQ